MEIGDHVVKLVYDEKTWTSSFNRLLKTVEPVLPIDADVADDLPSLPVTNEDTTRDQQKNSRAERDRPVEVTVRDSIMTRSRTLEQRRTDTGSDVRATDSRDQSEPQSARPWIHDDGIHTICSSFVKLNSLTDSEKNEAYMKERDNWKDMNAMEVVSRKLVPKSANVIGSHVRFVRKMDGRLKARICPWGNHDLDKYDLRTDAPSMLMEVFRLVLLIGVERKWDVGSMDVRAAFLQAKGFDRCVYVRPPREEANSGVLWKLLTPAYGLVDSGRLWYLTSNSALCSTYGLERSAYEPTLYNSRSEDGSLSLIVVVQVENYIYSGTTKAMEQFEMFLQTTFDVGEIDRNNFDVYGATISRLQDGSIIVDQKKKLKKLEELNLVTKATTTKSGNEIASPEEITRFRRAVGKLFFIGRMSHPVLLRIASTMATKVPALKAHHLKDLSSLVSYAISNAPVLVFKSTNLSTDDSFKIEVYSKASMGSKKDNFPRGGYIVFRRFGDIVHPIFWNSRKLRRSARSSATAEILAAADAVDKSYYIAKLAEEVHCRQNVHLGTDSRCLFQLIATNKEPEESRNKIDLAAMRSMFENGSL